MIAIAIVLVVLIDLIAALIIRANNFLNNFIINYFLYNFSNLF